jgi:hypothetical protein
MRRNQESSNPFPNTPVVKDLNNPADFGRPRQSMTGPVVAPGIKDPAALRYAAAAGARKDPAGRYAVPVAGGPSPSMPRLDAQVAPGMTMADQAAMQRAAEEPVASQGPPMPRGGMFQGGPVAPTQRIMPPPGARPPPGKPQAPPILSGDILPEEALKDPDYKQGGGSRYAASQPNLAYKYGVIRGNKRIPPQQLMATPRGLSDKTVADLESLAAVQKKAESGDAKAEQEAAQSPAGAAGRLGNSPKDGPQSSGPLTEEQKKAADEVLKNMDDFDFSAFRERMMKDIINNDDQRQIIEARCKPMDITDIIVDGCVTQTVPIVPGKFEVEFQSMRGDEDLAIKRLIMLENKGLEVTERYLLDKFSIMGVTIGVRRINNNLLPSHLDDEGNFDEKKFLEKFNMVCRLAFHMLASIGVNYYWFDVRVRKLFVADTLGNG